MVGLTAPMTVLGVTDPRRWTAAGWAADLVSHPAYGTVAAAAAHVLRQASSGVDAGRRWKAPDGGADEAVTVPRDPSRRV